MLDVTYVTPVTGERPRRAEPRLARHDLAREARGARGSRAARAHLGADPRVAAARSLRLPPRPGAPMMLMLLLLMLMLLLMMMMMMVMLMMMKVHEGDHCVSPLCRLVDDHHHHHHHHHHQCGLTIGWWTIGSWHGFPRRCKSSLMRSGDASARRPLPPRGLTRPTRSSALADERMMSQRQMGARGGGLAVTSVTSVPSDPLAWRRQRARGDGGDGPR